MSKTYIRSKQQGFKQNSNATNNGNNNRKMRNPKSFNKKTPRKYNNNNSVSGTKVQKKKEVCEVVPSMIKKMVHFNEIVEVGYTHPAEEYDRTSIVASKLTTDDILEILQLREQFRMETMEAVQQRAMEETQQSSPVLTNVIPTSNMNFAIYASTSVGNSCLLTEVPSVTPSILSSPVLTPRTNDDEVITQQQREIEYMIYQKQQMENNYLEALHYQQALQILAQQQQQQQNFELWRLYNQQPRIESDLYLKQANQTYYSSTFANNSASPSLSLWYAQEEALPLMTQMEVM